MIGIEIFLKDGTSRQFSLEQIVKELGISTDACALDIAIMRLESVRGDLIATVTDNGDYPSIDIDGRVDGKLYYATSTELPNEDADAIVARLYCGNSDTESDRPAATITLADRKEGDGSKRVVLYDGDFVRAFDTNSRLLRNKPVRELYEIITEEGWI